jgi:alpha-L-arabinofuranosidase
MTFKLRSLLLLALLGAVILIGGARPTVAQGPMLVYDETLRNGWQDWSWCTRDIASTAHAHSGTRSISATYTAAWQGLYFSHTTMDTSQLASLVFWIHGGAATGRSIQVQGLLAGTAQPAVNLNAYVDGGQVVAGVWKKVTIPLSALGIAAQPNFTGFWLQDTSGGAQPTFYVDDVILEGTPPPDTVHLVADIARTIRKVDFRTFAVNTAIWDGELNKPATISLLKAMGNRALRFPGGSLSDEYHWQTNTTRDNTWQWASNFDAFANVAKQTGAQAFITVNYGSGTPEEAAEWVRYSNITKGYGFRYWEIGNENYGPWEYDLQARPHDPYTYAVRAKQYIQAMKAIDRTIKIGVVAVTGEDSFSNGYTDHPATNPRTNQVHHGWTPVMLTTLKSLGVTPDYVIYHRYEQAPFTESDAGLLQSARGWRDDAADLRQQLTDYLGTAGARVELVCTENNSVFTQPGKQTTSLVNGLFQADSIGQILQTEFNGMVWWDLRNGQETGNNNDPSLYGWRQYGDYGIMSYANDLYPTYYTRKLAARWSGSGDSVVQAMSDYNLLTIYAVRRLSGVLSLMVINKSPTADLNARIRTPGFVPQSRATLYTYGVPQDQAARTGAGNPDIATTTRSGIADPFTHTFPPYSVTVFALAPISPLAPPSYLRATPISSTQIELWWANIVGETGYRLYRSLNGVDGWTLIARPDVNVTAFTDSQRAPNTRYYYRVHGYNSVTYSPWSPVASATTRP